MRGFVLHILLNSIHDQQGSGEYQVTVQKAGNVKGKRLYFPGKENSRITLKVQGTAQGMNENLYNK